VAVKTGTSNGFRDAWALGYSRRYVAGIWTGNADALGTNHLAGSTVATFLLELFKALQPDAVQGVGEETFPPPRGWETARICPVSGELAGDYCPSAIVERFPPGAAPREECLVHRRVIVDARTGNLADMATPAEARVARGITVLPPEYATFAASRGYGQPPGSAAALAQASVSLTAPIDGTRVLIDPETPLRFQTLALRATVSPAVPEVVWLVDGKEFAREAYPYEARWPLAAGTHSFQVRFAHAFIESRNVRVTVLAN
jgi:penicillin-binding protein 1C